MTRRRIRIVGGVLAAVCTVGALSLYVLWRSGKFGPPDRDVVKVMFGFYLLCGVMLLFIGQALSGLPVWKMSIAWNGLKGWQRGLLGTAIVAAAFYAAHVLFLGGALGHGGVIDWDALP